MSEYVDRAERSERPELQPINAGEELWQAKHGREAAFWSLWCQGSTGQPFRLALMDALADGVTPTRILELGCNAGPNLRLARARFPGAHLAGIDANAESIQLARNWLNGGDWLELETSTFDAALPRRANRSEDVVFSCYALAYLHPDRLGSIVGEALRIACRRLVLAEPHVLTADQPAELMTDFQWRHDYVRVLRSLGITLDKMTVRPLPSNTMWPQLNAIISVSLD